MKILINRTDMKEMTGKQKKKPYPEVVANKKLIYRIVVYPYK
jgi:hypothetical protein